MNRRERRRAGKLGQMPSRPARETEIVTVPTVNADLLSVGRTHHQAGRLAEAEACCRRALAAQPDHADALQLLGIIAHQTGRHDLAVGLISQAIKQNGQNAAYFCSLGIALKDQGKLDDAVTAYRQAVRIKTDLPEAHFNLGNARRDQGKLDEALAGYDRALTLRPDYAKVLFNHGVTLHELKRYDEALASYDRALSVRPDNADALNNRGATLHDLDQINEALASYDRALSVQPDHVGTHNNRGNALRELNRLDQALASYDRALGAKSDHPHAFSGAADCVMKLCDWDRRAWFAAEVNAHVSGKKSIVPPFGLLGYCGDPALQLQCARNYIENRFPWLPPPLWSGQTWHHDKVRIAYLSPDLRSHAMAFLTAEMFEQHDRSRFEIIGVSFGVDDRSATRKRLVAAFDEFHDVRRKSDKEIAKLLNDRHFDIAVDLAGHTLDSRPGIFAHRPAPIQVSYLGFPGTMGADFIDYIIADAMVLPVEHQPYYTEKVVYLPDCYLANDTKRKIAARTPTRQEMGLPEHAFVFCCFNNTWKITPEIFNIWMRLLHQVEGSMLWLLRANEGAERNLRREAGRRGIDPSRLVFAGRLPPAEHLARHRLADLFLDTLPYNAHTTASDALWMGLPVLTCKGEAFAGRVAASLLQAVGIPELITANLEDYQTLALKLAHDPAWLAEIKAKLMGHRNTYPLFDAVRFTRHIEAAYTKMWETWQRGEAPKSFSVEPAPEITGISSV
jgi:protein O-GlcNAc transferase